MKDRILQEQQELNLKIDKIEAFIQSDEFNKLNYSNQYLLQEQSKAMCKYNSILRIRLSTIK